MSLLLPDGITTIDDLPWTLAQAITTALSFLRMEELEKEERPPRSIWFDQKEMKKWWKAVERRREEKYGGKSEYPDDEPIEGPVSRNDTEALLGIRR